MDTPAGNTTTIERGFYRAQDTITVLITQAVTEQLIESSHHRIYGPDDTGTDWPYVLLVEAGAPAALGLTLLGSSSNQTVQSIGTGLVIGGAARGLQAPIKAGIKLLFGERETENHGDAADLGEPSPASSDLLGINRITGDPFQQVSR